MSHSIGSLVFTPAIKALQERYGSRRQYAKMDFSDASPARLGPEESEYIGERDTFYIATVGSTGWPYIQHRGGPKGLLKVIDQSTLAFADFRGNKQYISTGNLMTDNRVALILMDYPNRRRLKLYATVEAKDLSADPELAAKLTLPGYKAKVERAAFDWNCQQHIIPRYTAEEIRDAVSPAENHMHELEQENERLRQELARLKK